MAQLEGSVTSHDKFGESFKTAKLYNEGFLLLILSSTRFLRIEGGKGTFVETGDARASSEKRSSHSWARKRRGSPIDTCR